jgi:glycosyltransferase involved in cell wall biosynthesis
MNHFGDHARHSIMSAMPDQHGAADAIAPGIIVDFPKDAPPLAGRPSLSRYRALARYMQGFDLILTYNWGAMDAVAARRFFPAHCPPLIHHEDGFNEDEANGLFLKRTLFRRFALPAARAVVVPSTTLEQIARNIWRQPPARLYRIANGIKTGAFAGPPQAGILSGFARRPGEVVIGTVAALRAVKNISRLVAAVAGLPENVRLVVVGEGPDRPHIEARVRQLGMEGRVLLVGHVPGAHRYIGHFDIFALSSDSEQAPISLIEAMAAGLPVAAPDVGDIRHMVAAENVPYIVEKGTAALAQALAELIEGQALRQQLGRANQIKAQQAFDEAQMLDAYTRLYGIGDQREG